MAEFASSGAPGGAAPVMNGSEGNFPPAPMSTGNDAAKTLWFVTRHSPPPHPASAPMMSQPPHLYLQLDHLLTPYRMGEMEGWMDENFIKNIFSTVIGENVQVKVIRDRNSG